MIFFAIVSKAVHSLAVRCIVFFAQVGGSIPRLAKYRCHFFQKMETLSPNIGICDRYQGVNKRDDNA